MADLWHVFSNLDMAYSVIQKANANYSAYPGPEPLVGETIFKNGEKKHSTNLRARHAATIGAVPCKKIEPETVFSVAEKSKEPIDIQWAILTLLAIDESFREDVAKKSPPMAAKLTRAIPQRFERYIMGNPPNVVAMTPHEAVIDFALCVQFTFSTVEENQNH